MKAIYLIVCFLLFFAADAFANKELVVLFTADTRGYVLPCG